MPVGICGRVGHSNHVVHGGVNPLPREKGKFGVGKGASHSEV